MAKFLDKIEPKDVLAAVIIVGGFILMAEGIDTIVGGIVIMVTTYYFRKRTEGSDVKKPTIFVRKQSRTG